MKKRRAGMALAVVLSLITLVVLIALSVATTGVATLNLTGANQFSQQSVYAAEAGLNAAFREIIQGTGWTGYSDVAFGEQSRYSVVAEVGPKPASGSRPQIPANSVYLLATGTTRKKYPRQVAVLVRGTGTSQPAGRFPYAIAAGGKVEMQGGGAIAGSIKASEDVRLQGGIRVMPFQGNGRLLAGEDIELGNGIKRDVSQDMRARDEIKIGPRTASADPGLQIYPEDTTPDSAPFIADGRFTNTLSTGELGEVLPNPDPTRLLGLLPDGSGGYQVDAAGAYLIDPARTDVVQHAETTSAGFDLAGKIHFFPNGVKFSGNTNFGGRGSIVSGGGNGIEFQGNTGPAIMNVLALRWPNQSPSSGNPTIKFGGNTDLQGLVFAHEDVDIGGNFKLLGMIVAYRPNGGNVDGGGSRRITYSAAGLNLPGLESWLVPPSPSSGSPTLGINPGETLEVVWWHRL